MQPRNIDVRIVAATNRDLQAMMVALARICAAAVVSGSLGAERHDTDDREPGKVVCPREASGHRVLWL
jgi:hypothetical protein